MIGQAYLDLLHRPADAGGLAAWSSLIDAGQNPVQVISLFETTQEYRTSEVAEAYERFLHRPVDPAALQVWVNFLSGGGTIEQLDATIIASPEYLARRAGNSSTGFLLALYQDVLARAVDGSGASTWGVFLDQAIGPEAQLAARTQVAAVVLNSPEAHGDQVTGYYQQFLHRSPDASGFAGWVAALHSGARDETVIAGFVGSAEYARRLSPSAPPPPSTASERLISQAYLDLLHRPADPGGLAAWSSLIAAGQNPVLVISLFEKTTEYRTSEVAEAYQRFLHRPVDPAALQVWVNFLSGGGTIEQLDATIIASPEYFAKRAGNSSTGFLLALYQDVLARAVDGSGASTWGVFLDQAIGPEAQLAERTQVAAGVLNSPEARGDQVTGYYQQFLHRSPDASGFASWVAVLNSGARDESIIAGFVGSPEYAYRLSLTQPPTLSLLSPASGLTTANNITIVGQVSGNGSNVELLQAQVDSGTPTLVSFDATGNFQFTTTLPLDGTADGNHTVVFRATDSAGDVSTAAFAFTLAVPGPAAPKFDLSPASVTGSATDHMTSYARVTLVGRTDPSVQVTLLGTGLQTVSSNMGQFQFENVTLVPGDNPLTARATNASGSTDFSLTIHRSGQTSQPNEAIVWNQILLNAIVTDASTPPVASRALAMVQMAVYDAVNAVDGTPAHFVSVAAPAGASPEAAVAAAAHEVLTYLYPVQQSSLDSALASSLAQIPDGSAKTAGITVGQTVGGDIIALRAHDGFDTYVNYTPGTGPGVWQPTAPSYQDALLPQWATLQPFVMTSDNQFRPTAPPALDSQAWADAVNQVESLGAPDSTTRTADETQIARFWNDATGSYTPPGHWNAIAETVAQQQGDSLAEDAQLFAELDVTMGDAAIVAWDAKYTYNSWRPITAIQNADSAGNPEVMQDPSWTPFIITPNFPEYVSGHSTFSAAAATVLDSFFGSNVGFTATEDTLPGVTRSFTSFDQAAAEAGMSRIYGGIHFEFSNLDGQTAGRALGEYVISTFDITAATQPPKVIITSPVPAIGSSRVAAATNITVQGRVLDYLSGVARLEVQLDSGDFANVIFDAEGNFSVTTTLAVDGSADGAHVLNFRATNAAGIVAPLVPFSFTLDTALPQIMLASPTDGGPIDASTQLTGTVSAGSAITKLAYQLDAGVVVPVAFDPATGAFTQALDLSHAAAGEHTLTVSAENAAGSQATTTLRVNLAAPIPFMVSSVSPTDGSTDVGVTFRPKIVFSRPVDPTTLTASDFYATDPGGATIPAKIVPAADGSFAWLFFTNPLPGGAVITLHVDGSLIQAAADHALLDADMTGTAGSVLTASFTTVSLTPIEGTSLSGKIVDPGPDNQPMTFDDIRAGPDQRLHTADDIFLLPIAGVKVFILGMEDQGVVTDAQGNFQINSVPAGDVKLSIEGTTASNPPAGYYFPDMVMDLTIKAGQANTVMGSMGSADEQVANSTWPAVYLPRIQKSILHDVTGTEPMQIGLDSDAAQTLTADQQKQLSITVQAGSAVDANGNPMTDFQMGVSTVPPALVRDMLPVGVMQHTFDITIQALGVATFTTPAAITFPNVFNAAPGTKMNFLSFDHTTGRLEIDGTATVSADGKSVVSDPGNGITHPGWHGLAPAGSPTGPQCPGPASPSDPPLNLAQTGTDHDYLFVRDDEVPAPLVFTNNTERSDPNLGPCMGANMHDAPLIIRFSFNEAAAAKFLDMPDMPQFFLYPGATQEYSFALKPLAPKAPTAIGDILFGLQLKITVLQVNPGNILTDVPSEDRTIYIYRYLDVADDTIGLDDTLTFPDTVAGEGVTRTRAVFFNGDKAALPTVQVGDTSYGFISTPTSFPQLNIQWSPDKPGLLRSAVQIQTPTPGSVAKTPDSLTLSGKATAPLTINLNRQQLDDALAHLADNVQDEAFRLTATLTSNHISTAPLYYFTYQGNHSAILNFLGDEQPEIQQAIADMPGIGTGNVDVTTTLTSGFSPTPGVVVDTFTIFMRRVAGSFRDSQDLVTAVAVVDPTAKVQKLTIQQGPVAPYAKALPGDERALLAPDLRTAFENDVFTRIVQDFTPVTGVPPLAPDVSGDYGGLIFQTDATKGGDISIDWETGSIDGVAGNVDADALQQLEAQYLQINDYSKSQNPLETAFELAQAISQFDSVARSATVFLSQVFTARFDLGFDPSRNQLVQAVGQVASHELGHDLGLFETATTKVQKTASEVEVLTVSHGTASDNYYLSYAGDTTYDTGVAIPRFATAGQVQDALSTLTWLASGSGISVSGPTGGPYTVNFVNPTSTNPDAFYRGVNVPQIVQYLPANIDTPISVTPKTLTQGANKLVVTGQIKVNGNKGSQDIMAQGMLGTLKSFQPSITVPLLEMALRRGYDPLQTQQLALSAIVLSPALQSALQVASIDPDDPQPVEDPDQLQVPGQHLALLSTDGTIASGGLDFGTVAVNGSPGTTQQLTLTDYGSQDVVLNSVTVNGSSAFSVAPVAAGTVIKSGRSITLDVTFAPQGGGAYAGFLVIDSNAADLSGSTALAGVGQPTSAAISLLPFNNNLGGVQVGTTDTIDPSAPNAPPVPTVTNSGLQPLTISQIRVAAGKGQAEYAIGASLPPLPIVLQPGQSLSIPASFTPSQPGLRPGAIEILSNDPQVPDLRVPLVGTGLSANVQPNLANDYVALQYGPGSSSDTTVLRQRTDAMGGWNFFLAPEQTIAITIFDPTSGLVEHLEGFTQASGVPTEVVPGEFQASTAPDTIGNGIPDDIKFAIGLNPNKISTLGDGISDFDKLALGLDPLAGRPNVTGVVGALAVGASAQDIKVVADTQNTDKLTAYVATTGTGAGLAIADVSHFDHPVLLSQLALPGVSQNIDVDSQKKLAVVASGQAGLEIVDISDPTMPRLLRTIPVNATQVLLVNGLAYAGVQTTNGTELQAYDIATGDEVDSLVIGGQITALRSDGTMLYALENFATLQVFDLSGGGIMARGSLSIPGATGLLIASYNGLFVADGVAWLASDLDQVAVDVSQPDDLRLLYEERTRQGSGIALNGSGLGIMVGVGGPGTNTPDGLTVFQTTNPTVSGALVTRFPLPGTAEAVAISSGVAYVADGNAGIQIVNYLPFDTGSTPPSLDVQLLNQDITSTTPPFQLPEVSQVNLTVKTTDDVQVRNVELLVNGVVVQNEASYPFNLSTILPSIAQAGNQATLQVIATDTGGNSTFSAPILINLVPANPTITSIAPADKSTQAPPLRRVTVFFSQPIDETTLTANNFHLIGPSGTVAPNALAIGSDDVSLTLVYPLLGDGSYQIVVHAANVTNRVGLPIAASDLLYTFQVVTPPPPVVTPVIEAGRFSYVFEQPTSGQIRAIGDFNGDGIPDIAVPIGNTNPNGFASGIAVLLGQGDGSFKASSGVPAFSGAVYAAVTGDFNNDGKLDLALATDQGILILLGNGDGTFQAPINALPNGPTPFVVSGLAVGDFNGDGKLDLAAFGDPSTLDANELTEGARVFILLGNGDGTFNYSSSPGLTFEYLPVTDLTAADVNGDGKLDLVVTDKQNNNLYILKGNGDGSFPVDPNTGLPITTTIPLPAGAKLAVVADLNGDGIPDIAVTGNDDVSVLLGNGDGTFQPPVTYSVPGAYDITAADFSHDRRLDLVVSDLGTTNPATEEFSGGALYVLHNMGNGTFAAPVTITGVGSPLHLANGDFAADGGPDLLFTSIDQGVTVLSPDGKGSFVTAQRSAPLLGDPGSTTPANFLDMVAVADLNGDGNPDLIIPDLSGYIHTLLGNGDGTFTELAVNAPTLQLPPAELSNMLVADVNGDGHPDLVISNQNGYVMPNGIVVPDIEVLLGNGDGTFQARKQLTTVNPPAVLSTYGGMALGDFNGDGKLDLITVDQPGRLQISLGRGDGTFDDPSFIPVNVPVGAAYIEVGDFNGDGKLDIATLGGVLNTQPGAWQLSILLGNGDGTFSSNAINYSVPAYAANLTVADLNGDGIPDLLFTVPRDAGDTSVVNPSSSNSIDVMLGNGDGTFQTPVQYASTSHIGAYVDLAVADINGDGHPDILATTGNGLLGLFPEGPSFGLAVLLNNGDGTFGAPAFYDHAATTAGGLAVADFNKDKYPDVVVADLNDNTFSIIFTGPPPGNTPQPQLASGVGMDPGARPLVLSQQPPLIDVALSDWASAGLDASQLASMRAVHWQIANLGGNVLAEFAGNTITLDATADGDGWFVDPAPLSSTAFKPEATDRVFAALANGPASGHMDLLTVLLHELGHVVGLHDLTDALDANNIMAEWLPPGIRRSL
jgi:hypothetical protein